jgi:hypothetical protein
MKYFATKPNDADGAMAHTAAEAAGFRSKIRISAGTATTL